MKKKLIECIPNISEGRNQEVIHAITQSIQASYGVQLLNVDIGESANRTVFTFIGEPEHVVEAAFNMYVTASYLIDMEEHSGEHPRMGAVDVCPLVPLKNISAEETQEYALELAERVGEHLGIPTFLYEYSASAEHRKNLASIRKGEYEGLEEKLKKKRWQPDYGPSEMNYRFGATVIGVRDFLIAFNVNLDTDSVSIAQEIAEEIRESGRLVVDEAGEKYRIPGQCEGVKAIGWFMEEFNSVQVSMNITDLNACGIYEAYEACRDEARARGVEVNGAELVGLVPKNELLYAGLSYLYRSSREKGLSDKELIDIAVNEMGLNSVKAFKPRERILEYCMNPVQKDSADYKLGKYVKALASSHIVPAGGALTAVVGSFAAAIGKMISSFNKLLSDKKAEKFIYKMHSRNAREFSAYLLRLADRDTAAYKQYLDAVNLPQDGLRGGDLAMKAIDNAEIYTVRVPFEVIKCVNELILLIEEAAVEGNDGLKPDALIASLCAATAAKGALLNMHVNAEGLENEPVIKRMLYDAEKMESSVREISDNLYDKLYQRTKHRAGS